MKSLVYRGSRSTESRVYFAVLSPSLTYCPGRILSPFLLHPHATCSTYNDSRASSGYNQTVDFMCIFKYLLTFIYVYSKVTRTQLNCQALVFQSGTSFDLGQPIHGLLYQQHLLCSLRVKRYSVDDYAILLQRRIFGRATQAACSSLGEDGPSYTSWWSSNQVLLANRCSFVYLGCLPHVFVAVAQLGTVYTTIVRSPTAVNAEDIASHALLITVTPYIQTPLAVL